MKQEQQANSWYQEPFVWLLIAIPLASVIGGIVTGRLAVRSNDGLVVDDYYKKGLEINRVLERDHNAEELGIEADIQLVPDRGTFRIILTGNREFTPPDILTVSFLHSTRSGYDKLLVLKRKGHNLYQANLPELVRGSWHLQIESETWRVLKTILI